ncbi:MAG: LPS export ABC transporter permease LptG [Chitinophagaceae bacterium]|nr:LPS export ABC transporter permease LptG [Oligoflexus sp.]
MKLFFYVFRDFVKYVIGTLLIVVFLFVLFDFIHKTTRYIPRYNPETSLLIKLYLYNLPNLIAQSLPIASLLASVVTMVLLSRTNEITAMRAAGMGPFRLGLPIIVGGALVSLVSLCIGEFVQPKASARMHYIDDVQIARGSDTQVSEGARWLKSGNTLYNFRDYDPITNVMTGIRVIETGENFRPKRSLEARLATYRPDVKDWLLEDVKVLYFWPKGTLSYSEKKQVLPVSIPVEPAKLKKERRVPAELSSQELTDAIRKGDDSGKDIQAYRVDFHSKIAQYFAAFVLSLIGLKFGYKSERTMETARGVLVAVFIGVSYWVIMSSVRTLAVKGIVPPVLAAWVANVVIFGISIYNTMQGRSKT